MSVTLNKSFRTWPTFWWWCGITVFVLVISGGVAQENEASDSYILTRVRRSPQWQYSKAASETRDVGSNPPSSSSASSGGNTRFLGLFNTGSSYDRPSYHHQNRPYGGSGSGSNFGFSLNYGQNHHHHHRPHYGGGGGGGYYDPHYDHHSHGYHDHHHDYDHHHHHPPPSYHRPHYYPHHHNHYPSGGYHGGGYPPGPPGYFHGRSAGGGGATKSGAIPESASASAKKSK